MTTDIDGIKRNLAEEAEMLYQKGYKAGQESMANAYADDVARQQGRDEVWETARMLVGKSSSKLSDALKKIFDFYGDGRSVIRKFSASEVIEKLKAYEEKQNEIKVGDEVINGGVIGIVTLVECKDDGNKTYHTVGDDGYVWYLNDKVTRKTGRHFDAISEVLKQLQDDKPLSDDEVAKLMAGI